jgi:hypothetical protein
MASTLKDRLAEVSAELPRGWQARLAEFCRVKGPSVNAWVSGDTKSLEGEHLLKAAEFFGVTPQWMQTGKGPKRMGESGGTMVMEPPSTYVAARKATSQIRPTTPDYRTIVHTLCDSLEQQGVTVNVRTFVDLADATYRKLLG